MLSRSLNGLSVAEKDAFYYWPYNRPKTFVWLRVSMEIGLLWWPQRFASLCTRRLVTGMTPGVIGSQ